jgi:transcriptional regulator with XRE-family HTH domain
MQQNDMNAFMMEDRLKNILNRESVTAASVCRATGIDRGMMSRFLNGKINLSLKKLILVADHLGYNIEFVKRKSSRKGKVK